MDNEVMDDMIMIKEMDNDDVMDDMMMIRDMDFDVMDDMMRVREKRTLMHAMDDDMD
jgi:hypothetical protein